MAKSKARRVLLLLVGIIIDRSLATNFKAPVTYFLYVDQKAVINVLPGGMNYRRKGVGRLSTTIRIVEFLINLLVPRVLQSSTPSQKEENNFFEVWTLEFVASTKKLFSKLIKTQVGHFLYGTCSRVRAVGS